MSAAGVVFKRIRGHIVPIRNAAASGVATAARKTGLSLGHKVAQANRIEAKAVTKGYKAIQNQRNMRFYYPKNFVHSAMGQNALMGAYKAQGTNIKRADRAARIAQAIPKIQARNRKIAAGIGGATVATVGGGVGAVAYSNRKGRK